MKKGYDPIQFKFEKTSETEVIKKSKEFYNLMDQRRSVRYFSDEEVPFEVIENLVLSAGTSPSGAHQQPWTFVVVKSPELKKKIREAAEKEEKLSYETRMTEEWLAALEPIGTEWRKPFLEIAPYLIIVFRQRYGYDDNGDKKTHYYTSESVGISVGILISAIHHSGLVTLTHTPSPMNFLRKILNRPENEIPFILLPVGYPSEEAVVPNLKRKSLSEIMVVKD